LRRRLAAEDYFDGDLESTHFDAELEAAVEWYQRTHQLVQNGEVADGTLWSLNVLAERRVSQILVALDKWRETPLAPDAEGEFIWVNIPEFYAELRDGRELIYRWKVVVGRERGGRDSLGNPRGQTPRFSDSLEYIVFNPYWNVPSQIREEEYDPLIAADPNWLIDNGFEIAVDGSREWLRQMPGSGNALGQVKFLFPNQHDVYMHDTPSRRLFERPVRNYSHGCVRVHEPLDLAALLLERDRDWDAHRAGRYVQRMLDAGEEQWLSMIDPLPVHLVYISVAVDDDGRPNFLADPYAIDRPLVDVMQSRQYPSSIEFEEE
jgi:murein L,D-transpeptidase YcbB/YkuD